MIQQDTLTLHDFRRGVSPVTQTNSDAPFVSQIIDTQSLMSLVFVIALGTLSDPGFTTVVLMEHGDDPALADAAAVPDAELLPRRSRRPATTGSGPSVTPASSAMCG